MLASEVFRALETVLCSDRNRIANEKESHWTCDKIESEMDGEEHDSMTLWCEARS